MIWYRICSSLIPARSSYVQVVHSVLPKIGKAASETFQMIKQAHGKESLSLVLCLSGTSFLHSGEILLKMMSIPVSQEWSELNLRSKKLQRWCVPTAPKW
jgi:hypothetical protein